MRPDIGIKNIYFYKCLLFIACHLHFNNGNIEPVLNIARSQIQIISRL
jgi:hypothetical protein